MELFIIPAGIEPYLFRQACEGSNMYSDPAVIIIYLCHVENMTTMKTFSNNQNLIQDCAENYTAQLGFNHGIMLTLLMVVH